MAKRFAVIVCILIFLEAAAFAQTSYKTFIAKRTSVSLKIDGNLNEEAWKTAPVATDFIELRPITFRKEEAVNRTDIYILYKAVKSTKVQV